MTNKQKARAIQLIGAACMVAGIATYRSSDDFASWLAIGLTLIVGGRAWEWLQKE